MSIVYVSWKDNDYTWNNEIRLWSEVYDIIGDLVDGNCLVWKDAHVLWKNEHRVWQNVCEPIVDNISGAKNPEEWGEMPYQQQLKLQLQQQLQKDLDKLTDQKKSKLIEILMSIDGKKYKFEKHAKNKKDIKITIDDIKLISSNYLNIEIEYLK